MWAAREKKSLLQSHLGNPCTCSLLVLPGGQGEGEIERRENGGDDEEKAKKRRKSEE